MAASNTADRCRSRMNSSRRKDCKGQVLIEPGEIEIDVEKQQQREFFTLAERFRSAIDPDEVNKLGEEMGCMIFNAQWRIVKSEVRLPG